MFGLENQSFFDACKQACAPIDARLIYSPRE
jgi:hypothetical protein